MSAATPTGAELRAERERLGLSVKWVVNAAGAIMKLPWIANDVRYCENDREGREWDACRIAYAAALAAEEARRATAEPVPPEGVTVSRGSYGASIYLRGVFAATVKHDGTLDNWGIQRNPQHTPDVVEFVAAFMRYRAAQHAASDRQRRLDAVRAAEEAHREALAAFDVLYARTEKERKQGLAALNEARSAVHAAKREADL